MPRAAAVGRRSAQRPAASATGSEHPSPPAAGVGVESLNCEFSTSEEITLLVNRSAGFVLGSPTLGGHMPTPVQSALGTILSNNEARQLPCGVFGSFGWSGEAYVQSLPLQPQTRPPPSRKMHRECGRSPEAPYEHHVATSVHRCACRSRACTCTRGPAGLRGH